MFEHFTFGAKSQLPCRRLDDALPSPTDTSFFSSPLHTPPPTSFPFHMNPNQAGINDIVTRFSQQSLQPRDQMAQQFHAPEYPPVLEVDDDEEMDTPLEQVTQSTSVPSTLVPPPHATGACRRLQRQLTVQLQTCSSHVRDINALVEDMIISNAQCSLRDTASSQYSASPPPSRGSDEPSTLLVDPFDYDEGIGLDDMVEGFHEDERWALDGEMEASVRRAITANKIRKYNNLKYTRRRDVIVIDGKVKVRSIPRMRKRTAPRVPE